MTGVLAILILGVTCIQIAYTAMSVHFANSLDLHRLKGISISITALGAVIDLLIAVALFYLLHRSRTGFKQTDSVISRLMLFTINTGLLTSICAVLCLVTFVLYPNDLIYVTFFFCLSRLYCNSLFATLNCRRVTGDSIEGARNSAFTQLGAVNIVTSRASASHLRQTASAQNPPEHFASPSDDSLRVRNA